VLNGKGNYHAQGRQGTNFADGNFGILPKFVRWYGIEHISDIKRAQRNTHFWRGGLAGLSDREKVTLPWPVIETRCGCGGDGSGFAGSQLAEYGQHLRREVEGWVRHMSALLKGSGFTLGEDGAVALAGPCSSLVSAADQSWTAAGARPSG